MTQLANPRDETLASASDGRNVTYFSSDGLALHASVYGSPLEPWLPVVCLPGLTRNSRDFRDLAVFLSTHRHRPRRVICFDYRGRGRSSWDKNKDNYNPIVEMDDIFDGMAAMGVSRAVVVGTSRGGMIAMMMGVARPALLAGIVLNDIGPVVEPLGLARIKTYVGGTLSPEDWTDAVRILKRLHGAQFTSLNDEQWLALAHMSYRDESGQPVPDHDPALARVFVGADFDQPIPTLWKEFRALRSTPILTIRGGNSDLLSTSTVAAMASNHPRFESVTVPGEGHPPLLRGTHLLQRVSTFISGIEGSGPPPEAVIPKPLATYDPDN